MNINCRLPHIYTYNIIYIYKPTISPRVSPWLSNQSSEHWTCSSRQEGKPLVDLPQEPEMPTPNKWRPRCTWSSPKPSLWHSMLSQHHLFFPPKKWLHTNFLNSLLTLDISDFFQNPNKIYPPSIHLRNLPGPPGCPTHLRPPLGFRSSERTRTARRAAPWVLWSKTICFLPQLSDVQWIFH